MSKELPTYKEYVLAYDRQIIEMRIRTCGFNLTKISESLGINRGTLRKKVNDCGIRFPRQKVGQ